MDESNAPLTAEERRARRRELLARAKERRAAEGAGAPGSAGSQTPPRSPTSALGASFGAGPPLMSLGGSTASITPQRRASAAASRVGSTGSAMRYQRSQGADSGSGASGLLSAPTSNGVFPPEQASPVQRVVSRPREHRSLSGRSLGAGSASSTTGGISRAEREERRREMAERARLALETKIPEGYEQDLSYINVERQKSSTRSRSKTGSHAASPTRSRTHPHDDIRGADISPSGDYSDDESFSESASRFKRAHSEANTSFVSAKTPPTGPTGLSAGMEGDSPYLRPHESDLLPARATGEDSPNPSLPGAAAALVAQTEVVTQNSPEPAAPVLPVAETHHPDDGEDRYDYVFATKAPSLVDSAALGYSPKKSGDVQKSSEDRADASTSTAAPSCEPANRALLDEFDIPSALDREGSLSATLRQPSPPTPARRTLPPEDVVAEPSDAINRNSCEPQTAAGYGATGTTTTVTPAKNGTDAQSGKQKVYNNKDTNKTAALATEANPLYGAEPKRKCCCKCCPVCCDKLCCSVM